MFPKVHMLKAWSCNTVQGWPNHECSRLTNEWIHWWICSWLDYKVGPLWSRSLGEQNIPEGSILVPGLPPYSPFPSFHSTSVSATKKQAAWLQHRLPSRTLHVKAAYNNGSQPMGHDPIGVAYHIAYVSDIYIMTYNSSNITVVK